MTLNSIFRVTVYVTLFYYFNSNSPISSKKAGLGMTQFRSFQTESTVHRLSPILYERIGYLSHHRTAPIIQRIWQPRNWNVLPKPKRLGSRPHSGTVSGEGYRGRCWISAYATKAFNPGDQCPTVIDKVLDSATVLRPRVELTR